MKVELHNSLKDPMVLQATRVLITDDYGVPLAFTVEVTPGHWRHFRVGDEDFEQQLENHGINRTVITQVQKPKPR